MFPHGKGGGAADPKEGEALVAAYEAAVHLQNGGTVAEFQAAQDAAQRCVERKGPDGKTLETLFDNGRNATFTTSDGPKTVQAIRDACLTFRDQTIHEISARGCGLVEVLVDAEALENGGWAPEQVAVTPSQPGFWSTSCDFPAPNPHPGADFARYASELPDRCPGATSYWVPSTWSIHKEQSAYVTRRSAHLYCFYAEADRVGWHGDRGALGIEP